MTKGYEGKKYLILILCFLFIMPIFGSNVMSIPPAPILISPPNGTLTNDNTPTLTWNPAATAIRYDLQWDTTPSFSSPQTAVVGGTTYTLPTQSDHSYYWRVRGWDLLFPGPWSATWLFTIDTNPPGIPPLISPAPGTYTTDNTPTTDWGTASGGGVYYQIHLDDNSLFTSPTEHNTANTIYTWSTLPDDMYFWRVRARDAAMNWGLWSSSWHFIIDTIAPSAPTLLSPENGITTIDNTPYLDWSSVGGAISYHLQVDDSSGFTSPIISVNLGSSQYTCSPLPDDLYYWRVNAKDQAGNVGSWSSVRNFEVDTTPPGIPDLISPSDGALIMDNTPYLDWGSVATAVNYQIQVDNDVGFTSTLVDTVISATHYTTSTLDDDQYYWRVRARDMVGNWGTWSSVWDFTIDTQPPGNPTLVSPSDNAIISDNTPYLDWSSVATATLYNLQVDNNMDFSSPIIDIQDSSTYYTIVATLSDGEYHWRVRARDEAGNWGSWSSVYSFIVDTLAPTIENVGHDPSSPNDADTVDFSCDVTDLNGIDLVRLRYRINSGIWTYVTMALGIGNTYEVSFGPFSYGDLVEYYIVANDAAVPNNTAIEDNSGSYYSFTVVSSDVTSPEITNIGHLPLTPNDTETVTISVDLYDINGIQTATLYYRINGGSFTPTDLTLIAGITYEVEIGSFDYNDFIEYYIYAVDDSPNHNTATDDDSGLYYNFTIGASDVTGPIITDVTHTPIAVTELDTVVIECSVIDPNGVESVTLYYKINSGMWVTQTMTLISGSTYASSSLGPYSYGDLFEYYINATDNYPTNNYAVEDNGGIYYNFIVVFSDIAGPVIDDVEHSPINPTDATSVTINCTITDITGVKNASLYYRINSGDWISISMTLISGNQWLVIIGPFTADDVIEYYILAYDDAPIPNDGINDNEGLYYSFTVLEATTETTSLLYYLPFVSLLALILIRRKKR